MAVKIIGRTTHPGNIPEMQCSWFVVLDSVKFTRVRGRRAAGNADTNRGRPRILKVLQNPSVCFRRRKSRGWWRFGAIAGAERKAICERFLQIFF
jgi:hypothetical protein